MSVERFLILLVSIIAVLVLTLVDSRPIGFGASGGKVSSENGGLKPSSQHPDEGGCDEEAEAAFGSVRAGCSSIARPAPRGAA
jgi:hypothetical protein